MSKLNQFPNRREFLMSSAVAAGVACLGSGAKARHFFLPHLAEDLPNTHNMMIVGLKAMYLSHLPMFVNRGRGPNFDSPHRFQVILEATFTDRNDDLTEKYASDRASHPTVKMYTLNPAEFVLSRVDPNGTALRKFRGNAVFRGHLERGGQVFIGDESAPDGGLFDVNVVNLVHFHEFDPRATKPAKLEYLLFGKGAELFLAHFITKPIDFDQIIAVKLAGQSFTDDQLSKGKHVVFSVRGNTARERLKEKEKASGAFQLAGGAPKTLPFEVVREFYFEEGELSMPPTFDPTPEERKAGFQ
jgi:hypothetical protein